MLESPSAAALRVVNLSEMPPAWDWVGAAFRDTAQDWRQASDRNSRLPGWLPRRATLARAAAGWRAARCLGDGPSVLVTHGPRPALYGALLAGRRHPRMRHLAFSFNYTTLPGGLARSLTARALRRVERFVVFSTLERGLYADYFDLPAERFDMLYWGVRAPQIDLRDPREEQGDYICALGSQARDYATLVSAMRRLPALRLVIVAAPGNMAGIALPSNVTVRTNIALGQAMNILAHSRCMALPLNGSTVPCGHVTIVSAMHLGRPVIATESAGLTDYILPGVTATTCPAHDVAAWVDALSCAHDDPATAGRLGLAGQRFAREHCTEARVVDYFRAFLRAGRDPHQ